MSSLYNRATPPPAFTPDEVRDISVAVYKLDFQSERDWQSLLAKVGPEKLRSYAAIFDRWTRLYLKALGLDETAPPPGKRTADDKQRKTKDNT